MFLKYINELFQHACQVILYRKCHSLLGIFSQRMKYKIYASLKYALKTVISISRKGNLDIIHTYLEIVIPFQIRKIKYISWITNIDLHDRNIRWIFEYTLTTEICARVCIICSFMVILNYYIDKI